MSKRSKQKRVNVSVMTPTVNKKEYLLKALVFGYAEMTVDSCKNEEIWYKQAQEVNKFFKKRKGTRVTKSVGKVLDEKFQKLINLDRTYFGDKKHSTYVCMILIIYYLIEEMADTEMRLRFLHFRTKDILDELEKTSFIKDVSFDTQNYLKKVLEIVDK